MRDPKRIHQICLALEAWWNEPQNQDMRFWQLLMNYQPKAVDLWNVEDDVTLEYYVNLLNGINEEEDF